jgi:hypothetical protein
MQKVADTGQVSVYLSSRRYPFVLADTSKIHAELTLASIDTSIDLTNAKERLNHFLQYYQLT